MPIADFLDNSAELKTLVELIQTIMDLPNEAMTPDFIKGMTEEMEKSVTPFVRKVAIQSLVENFAASQQSKDDAKQTIDLFKDSFNDYIDSLEPSKEKREVLDNFFSILYEIFDTAVEQYHNVDITLKMTLDEGAHEPTYAHDSDAAADLYALEDMTLASHSTGNLVHTGVHIQLPEKWMAMIVPRSSIGMKTGLRLSNSVGIIDEQYLGELGVLYDNISDSDYTIHAGDRIAQLLIFPSYHFKAEVVDELQPTERGEGGFGSSGK